MSPPQEVLGGRYRLESVLGEGGMATVYRGVDTVLDRPVAVKVLASRFASDTTFVQRFRREAQSAAAMNHPNIVNVYDTGSDGDVHYIVMELVEGRTLRDVLQDGPLLPERAAEIAEQVAGGLAFAHERGIVHRDVKPGNIMITPSGDVKVMDFGIARATAGESLTQTATVLGTATYLSPEQAQGEQVDARSDLYSLGVVLYEMLTAHVPFEGESPVAVAYKHVREEPPRPRALNPDVPDALERVVLKAMAKNPENRYAGAAELRADLARFLAGRPVEATPLLPPDRTEVIARRTHETAVMPAAAVAPEPRRGRVVAIAFIVALLLAALGVGLFFLARNIIGTAPQVTVPRCIGNTVDGCRQLLEDRRLALGTVTKVIDAEVPAGTVLSQDPAPGKQVDEHGKVNLTISRGRAQVKMPDVRHKPVDEARAQLETAGFRVLTNEQHSDSDPAGTVIDQDPLPGKKVDEGSTVVLTVSSGPENATVPDLTGMTVDEARAALAAAGLVLGNVAEGFCVPPREAGTVCTQDPPPGSQQAAGSSVDVIVMTGESPTPTDSASPSTPPPT